MANRKQSRMLTFVDPKTEREFRRNGYVVVPFVEAQEHRWLARQIDGVVPHEAPFYSTALQPWTDELRSFEAALTARFQSRVDALFVDHEVRGSYALFKGASTEEAGGLVPFHQDNTFVEEDRFSGVVAWTPIGALESGAGPLFVVPGSHRRFREPRGSGSLRCRWRAVEWFIARTAVEVPVPYGSTLVYDGALIHGSPPNVSAKPRRVVGLGLTPRSAATIRCHGVDESTVETLRLVDDYFRVSDPCPTERPSEHILSTRVHTVPASNSARARVRLWLDCAIVAALSVTVGKADSLRRIVGTAPLAWSSPDVPLPTGCRGRFARRRPLAT